METSYEGTLAADGAGILTGIGLLTLTFHAISSAVRVPPLFRVTAAIGLSLYNMVMWQRSSPHPISPPREVLKGIGIAVGFIAINVVFDTLVSFFIRGGTSPIDAFFHSGLYGALDCLFIVGAIYVGIPWVVRWMFFYCGWGRAL
jgi:hypothetical protein